MENISSSILIHIRIKFYKEMRKQLGKSKHNKIDDILYDAVRCNTVSVMNLL